MFCPGRVVRSGYRTALAILAGLLLASCRGQATTPPSTTTVIADSNQPGTLSTPIEVRSSPEARIEAEMTPALPTAAPLPTAGATRPGIAGPAARPNELGEIPILEYHLITDADGRWSRSWEHFRGDLERLYRLGYRTVRLRDVIDDHIDVPAGFSPVVLTFDDSSPGQFTFIDQGGALIPDPHSAVGILDAFAQAHPDFGEHATFFVLPAADPPHNLFGQNQYQKQKLEYLVSHGMDVGNHTYWHQNLSRVSDPEVQRQIGQAIEAIHALLPDYPVDLLALPQGAWPVHRNLAIRGTWRGQVYQNRAIVLVGAQPALSPDHRDFDPLALPRIQATPEQLDLWLKALDTPAHHRYVSDGDPDRLTFPTELAGTLRRRPEMIPLPSPDPNLEVIQLR